MFNFTRLLAILVLALAPAFGQETARLPELPNSAIPAAFGASVGAQILQRVDALSLRSATLTLDSINKLRTEIPKITNPEHRAAAVAVLGALTLSPDELTQRLAATNLQPAAVTRLVAVAKKINDAARKDPAFATKLATTRESAAALIAQVAELPGTDIPALREQLNQFYEGSAVHSPLAANLGIAPTQSGEVPPLVVNNTATSWENYAVQEYGEERGHAVYGFLAPLCADCASLVKAPGISAHFDELLKNFQSNPIQLQTKDEYLNEFRRRLGNRRAYRALALTPEEYSDLVSAGKMTATLGTVTDSENQSIKNNVLAHMLKNPKDKTPILSVGDYPDIALVVAKGYAHRTDKSVYLFELEIPRLDVWGYEETFGMLPRKLAPKGTTLVTERFGEKNTVSETHVEESGTWVRTSWDIYEHSHILRETRYTSNLESFVYGSISNLNIRSVKKFAQEELSSYDFMAISPEDRAETLSRFGRSFGHDSEKRFAQLLAHGAELWPNVPAPVPSPAIFAAPGNGRSGGGIQTAEVRPAAQRLTFVGVGARDVYNPTAPFKVKFRGRVIEILAARVELRSSETSKSMFFERVGEQWRPLAGAPVLKLQDPFVSRVGSDLIVGGVETFPEEGGGLGYRTIFYRGKDLADLKPFAHGPDGMKDIRLIPLPTGKILVLTRPQGKVGGRGKIAATMIDDLGSLGPDAINRATVYEDLFTPDEWGGANELHLLKNGLVGVLGHIARFDEEGNRHYYPMAFAIDPATGSRGPMKILLERSQLPPGASKRPDIEDVLFSGGLVRGKGGTAELYVGAGDAEVYRVTIPDPFADFEDSSRLPQTLLFNGRVAEHPSDDALTDEVLQFARRLPDYPSRMSGKFSFSQTDIERAISLTRRVLAGLNPYVMVNRRVKDIIEFLDSGKGLRSGFESGHFSSADGNDKRAQAFRQEQERRLFAAHRSNQAGHPIYASVQFVNDLVGDPTWGNERFAPARINDGILAYGHAALALRGVEDSTTVSPTDSSRSEPQDVKPFHKLLEAVVKRVIADQYAFRDLIKMPDDRAEEYLRTYLSSTAMTKYLNNWVTYIEAQIHDVDVVPGMVKELRVSLRDAIGAGDPVPNRVLLDKLRRLCKARGIALRIIPKS